MPDEPRIRSRTELDMLLVNIETAVAVAKRSDFFSWVQGVFQGMLAHEVLVCGMPFPPVQRWRFEWLGSYPIPEHRLSELCRSDRGVMHSLLALWEDGGGVPLLLSAEPPAQARGLALSVTEELQRLDLGNGIAHGVASLDGSAACFFAFFKLRDVAGEREARMLHLLAPYLYAGWLRANLERVGAPGTQRATSAVILTSREAEVLNWVEHGKSNSEIAQILSISHLTVKNHIQKILRKLEVRNRAQAVAKGITLNLIRLRGMQGRS